MFIPVTLLDFKEIWRTHFRVELLAEEVRQRLAQNPIFTLKNAFEVLDFRGCGEISIVDIQRLVKQRGMFISEKEADSLLIRFSRGSGRNAFGQHEFIAELVPRIVNRW